MIEGERTVLHEMQQSDLPQIEAWRNEPAIAQFLLPANRTTEELQQWFGFREDQPNLAYFIVSTRDGRKIGYAGLRDIDWQERIASLEIVLGASELLGQGFGEDALRSLLTLAFDRLDLRKVYLAVLPFNSRAIAAYEKCGFRRQGVVREYILKDGRLWQPVLMQIIKDQFHLRGKIGDKEHTGPDER